jgi:hypothetical protein
MIRSKTENLLNNLSQREHRGKELQEEKKNKKKEKPNDTQIKRILARYRDMRTAVLLEMQPVFIFFHSHLH